MSINLTAMRWEYVPNGVTTSFAYLNLAQHADDVTVRLYDANGDAQALPSYSVTGLGVAAGGTVVFDTAPSVTATPGKLVIELVPRALSEIAPSDFASETAAERKVAWERPVMLALQLRALAARGVRLNAYDHAPLAELPRLSTLLEKYLYVNAAGAIVGAGPIAAGSVAFSTAGEDFVALADAAAMRAFLGSFANASLADMIGFSVKGRASGTGAPQDLTAAQLAAGLVAQAAFSVGAISGWTWSVDADGDASNDIDIASGGGIDSTGVTWLKGAAMAGKRLDAAWSAGAAGGLLDTGAIASSPYWLHAILKDSDQSVDYLASLSRTAPTLPGGYTYFRPFGWVKRESGANVAWDVQEIEGGAIWFAWRLPTRDVNLLNSLADVRVLSVAKVPLGVIVRALLDVVTFDASQAYAVRVTDPAETDSSPAVTDGALAQFGTTAAGGYAGSRHFVQTNISGQIAWRSGGAVTMDVARFSTAGFVWRR